MLVVKVTHQSPERLLLTGIPGGMGWMVFATLLGTALTAAAVGAAVFEFRRNGLGFNHIWIGLGFLVAQAIFWMGSVTLAVGRERLEPDAVTRRGRYSVRSPIVTTERPCEFTFDRIAAVRLDRRSEARPARTDGRASFDAQVVSATLRITSPRRAILLDSTENGRTERVRAVAAAVADFLEIEITGDDEEPEGNAPDGDESGR